MNAGRTTTWMLGLGLGAFMLAMSASPALAGDRDRGRGGDRHDDRRPAPKQFHNDRGRDRDHDRDRGRPSHHNGRDRRDDDRVSVRINFGSPAPMVSRRWVAERYEERVEQVCVEPARVEWRYIPEVIETRYDSCGNRYSVVVCPARYEEVLIPARFETRVTRVCIPGRFEEVECAPPRPSTRISIGGVFNF